MPTSSPSRWPTILIRCRRGPAAAGLAETPAQRQLAVHLHDRLPRPQGQPEGIKDWDDLVKPGVEVSRPPEDLGRRAMELPGRVGLRQEQVRLRRSGETVRQRTLRQRAVLDSGARGATTTFAQRGIGDVLLAWENEAFLAQKEARGGPVRHCRALPEHPGPAAVSVVDKWWIKRHPRVAEAYLKFLYSDQAQDIIGKTSTVRSGPPPKRSTRRNFPSSNWCD